MIGTTTKLTITLVIAVPLVQMVLTILPTTIRLLKYRFLVVVTGGLIGGVPQPRKKKATTAQKVRYRTGARMTRHHHVYKSTPRWTKIATPTLRVGIVNRKKRCIGRYRPGTLGILNVVTRSAKVLKRYWIALAALALTILIWSGWF